MKFLLITVLATLALLATLSSAAASAPSCHNATGSCTKDSFVCANEEIIPHAKRCDGVEDCADGTDEYMCDHEPTPFMDNTLEKRLAKTEVACVQCTCLKGAVNIPSTATGDWWKIALNAPRDHTMLTDAPGQQNRPCNPAGTTEITLNVYKKQNKGCRGWVCCFRQEKCKTCTIGSSASHCY